MLYISSQHFQKYEVKNGCPWPKCLHTLQEVLVAYSSSKLMCGICAIHALRRWVNVVTQCSYHLTQCGVTTHPQKTHLHKMSSSEPDSKASAYSVLFIFRLAICSIHIWSSSYSIESSCEASFLMWQKIAWNTTQSKC